MDYRSLGNTGLSVSRICFGSLALSPLQSSMSIQERVDLILFAMDMGVNIIDTAEIYQNYDLLQRILKISSSEPHIVSKSYAYQYSGMKYSVELALRELKCDHISIFMLHEQETELTLRGHSDALEYLCDAKAQGLISAIGISTHAVEVVNAAANMIEVDVIHPLYNRKGIGIIDGKSDDMLRAISKAHKNGKGIIGMKALAGGNLSRQSEEQLKHVRDLQVLDSVAIGMSSEQEIRNNCLMFDRLPVPNEIKSFVMSQERRIHIDEWCSGCGECQRKCSQGAIQISNGKAKVDYDKCVCCGYCGTVCRDFCIKIVRVV